MSLIPRAIQISTDKHDSGLAFFITCFYKREELLLRVGIYVSAASMAGAFGGLLATVYVI